jgi:hypothetical protein
LTGQSPHDGAFGVQLFDLDRDPLETTDRYDPGNPVHSEAGDLLRQYKSALIERYRRPEGPAQSIPEEEELRLLRELGYIR